MTGHRITLPNYRIDKKTGKPVKVDKRDASAKIRARKSKRVSVKRKGQTP